MVSVEIIVSMHRR